MTKFYMVYKLIECRSCDYINGTPSDRLVLAGVFQDSNALFNAKCHAIELAKEVREAEKVHYDMWSWVVKDMTGDTVFLVEQSGSKIDYT